VTVAGLVGLWRARRRRGAELLLVAAAYFTVASIAVIAVPRLRVPLDLAAAIGAGLLVAQLMRPGALEATTPNRVGSGTSSRRTRILVTLGVIVALIVATAGVALARNRVGDNARSQLRQSLDGDGRAVRRLAAFDAVSLVGGSTSPPSQADFKHAKTVADRLWLLSPRLSGGLRGDGRDAARALDEAIFELKVLELVTSGNRTPSPAEGLDASRAAYDTRIRATNARLPDWNTISANTAMRRAAQDVARLEQRLSRT
jgi:hypothetical protein